MFEFFDGSELSKGVGGDECSEWTEDVEWNADNYR
jgi:hypothetical protein